MNKNNMRYLASTDLLEIESVLDEWLAQGAPLSILAMLPETEKAAVPQLQSVCRQRNIALAGGIFPALIENGQFRTDGIWLMRFADTPYLALHENLSSGEGGARQTAQTIADGVKRHLPSAQQKTTLFMLFDAMVPNVSSILDELYLSLANRVHYAGVNAGSETFQPMPCLFDAERIVQNGVLVMLISPHHGAILEHGYIVPSATINASSTEGNRIAQIDWRPAFEVYQEMVKAHYGVEITRENFYQYGVHFPFGVLRANHNVVVRIPVALDDSGALFCVGEVPANSVLVVLEAPQVDSELTLQALTEGLAGLNGGSADEEVLLFYCAGRRMHMGLAAASHELAGFAKRTQAAKVGGALSLGEIGGSTLWGYPLFHNATLVTTLW
ncbi:MAG: FIST N-terminal domain-containing protein [Gallionella sp.]|nr:FIST N-terminal domain-containing protein [Gallionella sp.]